MTAMATVDHDSKAHSTNGNGKPYKVIGSRPIRHDGVDKVTGRAKYGADVHLAGLLAGVVLRSPHAHARIKSINVSKALALPGVRSVITHKDLREPGNRIVELGEGAVNLRHLSNNILAADKVLYRGHAVVAVAADSVHIAEEAAGLIKIEYEILPPVLEVQAAMKSDAPLLHSDLFTDELGEQAAQRGCRGVTIDRHRLRLRRLHAERSGDGVAHLGQLPGAGDRRCVRRAGARRQGRAAPGLRPRRAVRAARRRRASRRSGRVRRRSSRCGARV
jgi:hypothetical protein